MSLKLTDEEICKIIINEDSELDIALDRVLESLNIQAKEVMDLEQMGSACPSSLKYALNDHSLETLVKREMFHLIATGKTLEETKDTLLKEGLVKGLVKQ